MNKPNDILAGRKTAFANSSNQIHQWSQSHADQGVPLELVEQAISDAIELVQALEVQAATPRHIHGETHNHYNRQDIHSDVFVAHKTEYQVGGHAVENSLSVEVNQDKFYKLSTDLIFASSGRLVIRPLSKKLVTSVGEIELTDGEVSRLLSFLKLDYGV